MKNWLNRFIGTSLTSSPDHWWGLTPESNDAEPYGVFVVEADVPEEQPYWRAVRVHHLTPEENHGNHHICFDVLDEEGQRLYGSRLQVMWDGGEDVVVVDKPANEPGANFPMWRGQVCSVICVGLPSDRVEGLTTAPPDEAPGNTRFCHSFLVVYQRAIRRRVASESIIRGHVIGGSGLVVRLLADGTELARQTIAENDTFTFTGLAAGSYVVHVVGTPLISDPLALDGRNSIELKLSLVTKTPARRLLPHYVLCGSQADFLLALDYLLAFKPAFGFRADDASQADRVTIIGNSVDQEVETALRNAGCEAERIQGNAAQIARVLAQRVAAGTP